jgi:hypothetical protein
MTTNEGAPERVWIFEGEVYGPAPRSVEYVRADLVEGLVEALREIVDAEQGYRDRGIWNASLDAVADIARAALSRYEATRKTRGTDEQR